MEVKWTWLQTDDGRLYWKAEQIIGQSEDGSPIIGEVREGPKEGIPDLGGANPREALERSLGDEFARIEVALMVD